MYTRIGNQVTAYYNIEFDSLGGDNFVGGTKFFGIGNLPFPFKSSYSATPLDVASPIGSDLPNGFVGSTPAPNVTVFPPGRTATLYEQGASVNLVQWAVIPVNAGTWIADGTTLLVEGPAAFKIIVPIPYSEADKASSLMLTSGFVSFANSRTHTLKYIIYGSPAIS